MAAFDDPIAGVSVVIPSYNAASFLGEALASIAAQDAVDDVAVEAIVVDDGSTDDTRGVAAGMVEACARRGVSLRVVALGANGGAAAARNAGVAAGSHDWIVSADADDTSSPRRVGALVRCARRTADARDTLFGARFLRDPPDATARYADWANTLAPDRLRLECFREVTLLQPTWFFHRDVWRAAGGYDGDTCDDLRFFLRHVARGGRLLRVDEPLVTYRRVPGSLSFTTSRRELVRQRVAFFASMVLDRDWAGRAFHVWGAGRDGRCFVNALADAGRVAAVAALYDVDPKKLGTYHNGATGLSLPVRHVDAIEAPFVCCVAMRDAAFLAKVRDVAGRLGATEGVDYWHFN